jgi:2-succinyl-6-hydroxy-2,4-cyclohexadiene-1-carboxylate synthase
MTLPAVVLHGFTGSGAAMAGVVRALRTGGRQVSAPDLVGHGSPPAPTDPAAYTMDACVESIAGLLDGPTHVVGYSMGGRVALALAVAHAERVATLALIGASPGLADEAARVERRAADEALAASIGTLGIEAFVDRWEQLPLFATQARRLDVATRAAIRRARLAHDPAGLAASLRGMGTGSMRPLHSDLHMLAMPVLLMAGADDAKYCQIAADMAACLPDARLVVVPGAGHAAHLERPDLVHAELAAFLAAHDQ